MGLFTDKLKSGVVGETARALSGNTKTPGKILDADEKSNYCTLQYIDSLGKPQKKSQVQVSPQNINWFPKKDDFVLVELNGDNNPVIVAEYITDYQSDVRGKTRLKNDTLPDDAGTCIGGQIL